MKYLHTRFVSAWQSLTPLTRGLIVFSLINIVVLNVFWMVGCGIPFLETSLDSTLRTLLGVGQTDSWEPMHTAFAYLKEQNSKEPIYSKVFFDGGVKFQYPLSSILIFYIKRLYFLTEKQVLWNVMNHLSWIFAVAMPFFAIEIFNLSLKKTTNDDRYFAKTEQIVRNVTLFILVITFYPFAKSYNNGQIQTWLNTLFAIAVWCWMTNREKISGVLIGLTCLFKPQYGIVLIWAALRRRWAFLWGAIPVLVGINLISIWCFGLVHNLNYLSVLSFLSRHGESFYPNHSVNGLLNRLLRNGHNLGTESLDSKFPPFNRIVYIGSVINNVCFVTLALFGFLRKSTSHIHALHLCWVVLAATIASPIAWEHHYGILIPTYALLVPYLLKYPILGKMTIPFLCLSYILSSNYFAITKRVAYTPFNFVQSYLLFGALMVLFCLGAVIRQHESLNKEKWFKLETP